MEDLEHEASSSHFERKDGKPLYEQVAAWLLEQVTSERWPIHHMLPPEITLAEELGVSRITLRKAMSELVRHGIFTRISGHGTFVAMQGQDDLQKAIRKVSLLQPAASNETRLIGVVVPSTTSAFVSAILAHLEHACYERGYRMLLTNSQDSLTLQAEHLRQLVDFGVAGIVLYSGAFMYDQTINNLLRRKFPLVLLDRYYPAMEKETSIVTSDHARGGYLMTEHLLRLGHRRIGFVIANTEVVTSTLARFEGYKAALKDYGVAFEEQLVMQAQISEETVRAYLERAGKPTAVFATNDVRAIELSHVLHNLGLVVPDDLALVGCDDIPLVSRLNPPLTTIAQNTHQLGETCAHLLIDIIEGTVTEPKCIIIPTEIVVRQSCGASAREELPPAANGGTGELITTVEPKRRQTARRRAT